MLSQRDPELTLGVIVINHHRPDLLTASLRALALSHRRPDEIVVVETEALLPPALPEGDGIADLPVRLLALEDNPGYAAACNRGAAQVATEWLLFLNADVMVSPACLGTVLRHASADPSVGIATCRLVRPDGGLDHACHRGIPSALDSLAYKLRLDRLVPGSRRLGHYRLSWLDPFGDHDIEACSGAFLLIRRSALEAVRGWDERYWFYGEDLDLCLRVTQAGWRVRYLGSVTALHLKGSSSHLWRGMRDLTPEERSTRRRVKAAIIDSHERFYVQHMERRTAPVLRPFVRAMFAVQQRWAAFRAAR